MPFGLNVWVENGDLIFYAQRSGCFDENNEFLKLGRIRVCIEDSPFVDYESFKQELHLKESYQSIEVSKNGLQIRFKIWAEVARPVIHLEMQSNQEIAARVSYEGWRNAIEEIPNNPKHDRFGCFSWECYPGQVFRYPDKVQHEDNSVLFYHKNREDKLVFNHLVKQQGLEHVKDQLTNTQSGRTFGGKLSGDNLIADGVTEGRYINTNFKAWHLKTENKTQSLHVCLHSEISQTENFDSWKEALESLISQEITKSEAWNHSRQWWESFWNRSWLIMDPGNVDSKEWELGRNYQVFRYQLGCNAFGEYPTKFNGGNFTTDPSLNQQSETHNEDNWTQIKKDFNPDWRAWGGGSFTAQNQRLLHWPLLKTGDFDLMHPQFEFYRRALPSARARVKEYFNHEGCLFAEQIENFGLPFGGGWGWDQSLGESIRGRGSEVPFADPSVDGTAHYNESIEAGVQADDYVSYHWESQLEFSYMILEYHRFTQRDISTYLPFIEQSVQFFFAHYKIRRSIQGKDELDNNAKLIIYPSTSCESYRGAKNPTDVIAGLEACIHGILELKDEEYSEVNKNKYEQYLSEIPPYSYENLDGKEVIKPAFSWERYQNVECPQFYPLFPFNRFSVDDDDMSPFKNAWDKGDFSKELFISWHYQGIAFARMGMTQEAANFNTLKMQNSERRFPTFWGPGHDWVPDHNWGGSGMIGLQEMLFQCIGDSITLFPAWPKDWDVQFKFHAPQSTTVEVNYSNGEITKLVVSPESRKKDVTSKFE